MIFEETTNPTKIIEVKMIDDSIIKIHLKGVDFQQEQFIAAPAANKVITSQEQADLIGADTASRLIRSVITKIEGVKIRDKKSGDIVDFKLIFNDRGMITIPCYTLIMRILNSSANSVETLEQIKAFYNESIDLKPVEEKKKK